MELLITSTLILLSLSSTLLFLLYKRIQKMSTLQRSGIPCPPPSLLWGNIKEYSSMGNIAFHKKLLAEYGPIVGYYLGGIPYVIVAHQSLLHKILVTDAKEFIQRPRRIPGGVNPDPRRKRMLAHLPPEEWQILRKTLTSIFNPTKLKKMIPTVEQMVGGFMDVVENQVNESIERAEAGVAGGEVELGSLFETLSLSLIGHVAFGRSAAIDWKNRGQDPLLLAAQDKYFKPILSPMNQLSLCLPELKGLISPLRIQWNKWTSRPEELKRPSLWDIAWECMEHSLKKGAGEQDENGNPLPIPEYNQFQMLAKKGIPIELMAAYSVNAFQGDYENVTTTLRFLTHLLAANPEIQEKIRAEFRRVRDEVKAEAASAASSGSGSSAGEESYAIYSQLKYMESVVYEMLRIWPQTSMIRRSPHKDYVYEDEESGERFTFPAGVHVQVAHAQVQREPSVWGEEAELFKPERFYKEGGDRDKVSPNCASYQGFGSGPRHCLGQKFAMLVLKMITTTILDKYGLATGGRTGELSQYADSTMNPNESFYIKLVPLTIIAYR